MEESDDLECEMDHMFSILIRKLDGQLSYFPAPTKDQPSFYDQWVKHRFYLKPNMLPKVIMFLNQKIDCV